jgi:ABC-2 type transport system permease protein
MTRATLSFLMPIAFAITIPAISLVGRLEWPVFLGTLAVATAMLAVSRWFWRQGIRHYAGASA